VPPGQPAKLKLVDQKVLSTSGIVVLSYLIAGRKVPGAKIAFIKRKAAKKFIRKGSARKGR
jgi:hypothetical protein